MTSEDVATNRRVLSITLGEELSEYETPDWGEQRKLEPLGRVNILVGANNSGKSRLLRALAGSRAKLTGRLAGLPLEEVATALNEVYGRIAQILDRADLNVIAGISSNHLRKRNFSPTELSGATSHLVRNLEKLSVFNEPQRFRREPTPETLQALRGLARRGLDALAGAPDLPLGDFPHVYIPVLRGLRNLSSASDVYSERTRRDYFAKSGGKIEVFTGLGLYEEVRKRLLGPNADRLQIQQYQESLSRVFFEGRDVSLIPRHDDDVLHVKIGRETERPIYKLGDGLQACIALSFLPCVSLEPTWFFIEEPEVHLHPGLQRKLLRMLLDQEQHLFFTTTHSNHLLDMTLDFSNVAVFNLRKVLPSEPESDELDASFEVWQASRADQDTLSLLGVRNSSVFLVNATVWVEGITDRLYLRRMLELYQEDAKSKDSDLPAIDEDVHFAFVEYGGSNLAHWSFLEEESNDTQTAARNLCSRAFLIADSDNGKALARKAWLREQLGDHFKVLPAREVENLLPLSVICSTVAGYEWSEVASGKFTWGDYKDECLGRWIEDTLLAGKHKRRGGYAADSGTIKSKPAFCRKALEHLRWADLALEVQTLVRHVYDFVAQQNDLVSDCGKLDTPNSN